MGDFVVSAYKTLPGAVHRSFSFQALSAAGSSMASTRRPESDPIASPKPSPGIFSTPSKSINDGGAASDRVDSTKMDTSGGMETPQQQSRTNPSSRPLATDTL